MNAQLLDFEKAVELGPVHASKLLGVAWSTYCGYRSTRRELPKYIAYHIDTLLNLSSVALNRAIRNRVFNA